MEDAFGREIGGPMAKGMARDVDKESFWRNRITEQAGSGLTIRGYCRRQRLPETSFYCWRRELARRQVSASSPAMFMPVQVPSADSVADTDRMIIGLPNGCEIRLRGPVDRRALAEVLAVLGGPSC
jgi:hypothetical protein